VLVLTELCVISMLSGVGEGSWHQTGQKG